MYAAASVGHCYQCHGACADSRRIRQRIGRRPGSRQTALRDGPRQGVPRRFFGHLAPGTSTPTYNIILIGLLSFGGAEILNYFGTPTNKPANS